MLSLAAHEYSRLFWESADQLNELCSHPVRLLRFMVIGLGLAFFVENLAKQKKKEKKTTSKSPIIKHIT